MFLVNGKPGRHHRKHHTMASKRGKGGKSSIRQFRSDAAKLKRAGLLSSDVDIRSLQPSDALKRKIRKYRDVVDGKATTVKARSPRAAKVAASRAGFQSQGALIVVPKHRGMRPRYDRGYVKASGTTFGQRIHQIYVKPGNIKDLPAPHEGHYYVYKVPFAQYNDFQQFSSLESYERYRDDYHRRNRYLDMDERVIIEEVPEDYDGQET